MGSKKYQISKVYNRRIVRNENNVYFEIMINGKTGKELITEETDKVVGERINDKKKGIGKNALCKTKEGEDKSEGKYELIKNICEEVLKSSINFKKIKENLDELNKKNFPTENIKGKSITKEDIISYSLSNFGKEIGMENYIVNWLDNGFQPNDIDEILKKKKRIEENKRQYFKNAKKIIEKSLNNNKVIARECKFEELKNEEVFEEIVNIYQLKGLISKINKRNKQKDSIYDIYKKHQADIYGRKNTPNNVNRDNKNLRSLDILVREILELKKYKAKNINDRILDYNEIENILKMKIKNKRINYKLNQKEYSNSSELIEKRITDNMIRKLIYYSYEANNKLLQKRIKIAEENEIKKSKEQLEKELERIEKIQSIKLRTIRETAWNSDKERIISGIKEDIELLGSPINLLKLFTKLKEIPKFNEKEGKEKGKFISEFNKLIPELKDEIELEVKKYKNICPKIKEDKIKEIADLVGENPNKETIYYEYLNEKENFDIAYEEIHKIRNIRNILSHSKTNKQNENVNEEQINLIINGYIDNILKEVENSELYKVAESIKSKSIFIECLEENGEKYQFVPSSKSILKDKNFTYRNELTPEQYKLLKKIYDNVFIIDKDYQEKNYQDAVEILETEELKIDYKLHKGEQLQDKLLELQKRYNNGKENIKERKEKYILEIIYTEMFNNYLDRVIIYDNKIREIEKDEILKSVREELKKKKELYKKELSTIDAHYFYLIKNLSEKSRSNLKHQMVSVIAFKEDFKIGEVEMKTIIPIFKYFKNYNLFPKETDKDFVKYFYEVEALEVLDSNGSKFENRLNQIKDISGEIQKAKHIRSLYYDSFTKKIKDYFSKENNKIKKEKIEKFLQMESQALDLNNILKEPDNEKKKQELKEFNEYKNFKSEIMLEDVASVNYILNDIYAILLKFITTSDMILTKIFKEKIGENESFFNCKNKNDLAKEYFPDILSQSSGSLKNTLDKISEKKEDHYMVRIRNSFCHYEENLLNKLSILDMINLVRYQNSFDRKQKNNVTRAIVNYFDKKNLKVDFKFDNNHYIYDVDIKNKNLDEVKPYFSEYKISLLKDLLMYKIEEN